MKNRSILHRSALVSQSFTVAVAALVFCHSADAQNTTNNYSGSATGSLLLTSNWSLGHVPTVSEDAVFPFTTGIRTLTAGSLTVGSFNAMATSAATFTIRNSTATATDSTLTLGGVGNLGNKVSGTTADLLFTSSFSTFNIDGPNGSTGSGVLNMALGQSGNINATGTINISAAISDGGSGFGITKTGVGTLTLTGANTYTGPTAFNAGTLTLGSGGSLSSSSTLAVGGNGVFNFNGAAATTQTVNGLNVNAGFGTVNNTVSGTTLTLGGITRSGGGMVDFATTTGNINTSAANTNGIIGTWAFQGTGITLDYAVSNGAGNAISSLSAATVLPNSGPGVATTHYTLAGAQTQTANAVGNTLRYTGGAFTLGLGTTSLGLSGLMNAGTGLLTISGTAGNSGLVTTGELDIASNTQGITISSVISGTGSVVYGGPSAGTLTLSGANIYAGGTTINSGILKASNNSALGTGTATVSNGARLQLDGVNLGNAVNLNGSSALLANSGTNTLSGAVTLQAASTFSFTAANNNALTLNNSLNLAGNVLTITTVSNTGSLATISGTITGAGGITKASDGTLTISANNSPAYTGTTSLNRGTLALGDDGALGSGTFAFAVGNDTTATIRSTDVVATTRTINNVVTIGGNGNSVHNFGTTTTGDLAFTNTTAINLGSTTRKFSIGNASTQFAAGFSGSGGLIKQTGLGILVLNGANTYTGATTISAGTLLLNGSLGATAVSVNGNGTTEGTLSGTGSIGGSVTVNDKGHFAVAIAATPGAQDPLAITGDLTLVSGNILDLTAASAPAAGVYTLATAAGTGGVTYTAGTVNFTGVSGVVSVSGNSLILTVGGGGSANFAGWASANGITGGVNGDSDNDGISNGVEYGLNTNFAGSDGSPGTYSGNLLTFNKRTATSGNSDLSYRIEVSTDLGVSVPWTDVGAYVQNTGSIISATIPNGPSKNFARLRVIVNP